MKIYEDDIKLISLIDKQVNLLFDKNASDNTIINTLSEFIPHVNCLINEISFYELQHHYTNHPGFSYFVYLLALNLNDDQNDRTGISSASWYEV